MQNNGRRPSVEGFVAESKSVLSLSLGSSFFPKSMFMSLADILRREEVSRSRLMPTMDNVAADVRRNLLRASDLTAR